MAKGGKNKSNEDQDKGLGICVDAYVAHLELSGKAPPSVRSYHSDLKLLARHFGEDKALSKILAPHVARFLKSPVFTTKASGEPKAELSLKKSRRAVKQFFEWLASQGLIDHAPVATNRREMP